MSEDEGILSIRQQAALLDDMTGPGRGVLAEHLISRLTTVDPATAELVGRLIRGLGSHEATSLTQLGRAVVDHAHRMPKPATDSRSPIDVFIVAPKPVEEEAVLAAFGISRTVRVQTGASRFSGYKGESGGRTIVVCSPHNDGNVRMALYVGEWLREWRPRLGALVGMAGGRPKMVIPGDIVLATAIFDYQIVRRIATPAGPVDKQRFVPHSVREDLTTNFTRVDENEWAESMRTACRVAMASAPRGKRLSATAFRKWKPTLKSGVILAGSTLIEDNSIEMRADEIHDKAIAVEMEGAGFAASMIANQVPWVSLRGIADMGGHPDYVGEDGESRTKEWQFAATYAAADRLRVVLPDINVLAENTKS